MPLNKFSNSIYLSNVSFKYSSDGKKVLDEINLQIKPGTKVGLIGTTGSGKSTLVDILMGLLKPTSGEVFYGSDSIYESESKLLRLRDSIAHVPQSIYLTDRSIAENIAIGMHFDDINMQKVKEVSSVAQISDFIESLPQSYDTIIGERGALLSGGQRQRIGIARALYKNASILVLDEATSALDLKTELMLMDSLVHYSENLTIISITHREQILDYCDEIYFLQSGFLHKKP